MTKLQKIGFIAFGIVLALFTGYGVRLAIQKNNSFGASLPQTPAQFETSLAVPQATSDTSMTLASATLGNGSTLSGYYCFTVNSNTSLSEYECGTASTTLPTLITGLTRGVDPQYGTSSIASLIRSHRTGADVRITDYPALTIFQQTLNGNTALPNPIFYNNISTSTLAGNVNNLVTVDYINGVALQGEPTATNTTPGIVRIGTAAQIVSGTGIIGGYTLVPGLSLFSPTSSATTIIPVTLATGKLSQNFLDLTQNYTWSGIQNFTGTLQIGGQTVSTSSLSKFGGTGVDGAFTATSATTTINLGGAQFYVKNYTSVSVTGTTTNIQFTNPSPNGTIVVFKSQGACTLTSTSTRMFDLRGIGAVSSTDGIGITKGPTTGNQILANVEQSGPSNGNWMINTYGIGVHIVTGTPMVKYSLFTGAGGSPSFSPSGMQATGGVGGGSIYFECGGSLTFTGKVDVSGGTGGVSGTVGINGQYMAGWGGGSNTDGSQSGVNYQSSGSGVLGGGGGGAGSAVILANSIVSNTGTITTTGGTGGTGSSGNGASGGSGFSYVGLNTEY